MTARLWSPLQVARRLGVRRTLVLRLIRRRDLAAVKVGRIWRIEPEAVDAYIATRRQDARDLDAPPPVDDRQIPLFLDDLDPRLALATDPRGVETSTTAHAEDIDP
jgi:excisionase family DNA binding protein